MAEPPFAPWADAGSGVADLRPWEAREFGSLYRACAPLGYKRDDVDDLFVFEVAALLGVGEPKDEPAARGEESGVERAVARMRAAELGLPQPEAQPLAPDVAEFMGAL